MASLEKRNDSYRVVFRLAGRKFSRSLRTRSETAATASLARLEDNLRRVELGTLEIPDDADIATFLLSDGRAVAVPKLPEVLTFGELCKRFYATLDNGSLEASTVTGMQIHKRHLLRLLGKRLLLSEITLETLQGYVDARAREKGIRGGKVSPATIRKEITTLTCIWSWAQRTGYVEKVLPKRGLRYPKGKEKAPFQTWGEIERKIARGCLKDGEAAELWDSLFLTVTEVGELLKHVEQRARQPFLYPMFAFAAHTGARRSEMIRSRIEDIDFDSQTITIREKKRVRGKSTTRRVPLSEKLSDVLTEWFERHPGGQHTFCLEQIVVRSKKRRPVPEPLTMHEAHNHFKQSLAGSKWEKLRGWHVFRHSFCSNCAAAAIDQRIINAWVGHQTEEMVRRYRHLIPDQQQEAIRRVFGAADVADRNVC